MMSARQTHRFVMKFRSWRMLISCQWTAVLKRHNDPASPMRVLSVVSFLTLFVMAMAADAAPLPAPSPVDIPLAKGTLHAQLYKPEGEGPFPTVIALHGCGGGGGPSQP